MGQDPELELPVSTARFLIGFVSCAGIGAFCVFLSLAPDMPMVMRTSLRIIAGLFLFLTHRLWQVRSGKVVLREDGLWDETGDLICAIDEINQVQDRIFDFKPSRGFLVILKSPAQSRRWRPGLWYRFGKRVGIGGMTHAGQGKAMAQALQVRLAVLSG